MSFIAQVKSEYAEQSLSHDQSSFLKFDFSGISNLSIQQQNTSNLSVNNGYGMHNTSEETSHIKPKLKQSLPYETGGKVIDKRVEQMNNSDNSICSIHQQVYKMQEKDLIMELQAKVQFLENRVNMLEKENSALKANRFSTAEESMQTAQARSAQAQQINYKEKYLEYKQKCKILLNKHAELERLMHQRQ